MNRRQIKRQASKTSNCNDAGFESLIDADAITFDEVLAPVRESFAKGGATEQELDDAVKEARKAIHARSRRKSRK